MDVKEVETNLPANNEDILNNNDLIENSGDIKDNYKNKGLIKIIKKNTYLFIKRFCDIIFSIIVLIFVALLTIFIKISYMLTGDFHSIFFKQIRTGKNGKNFKLYKFRSMVYKNDVRDSSKEDQYTKVGKILRRLSLDELPQAFNILKGNMSFIGPRPWIPEYYQNFNEIQKHRCDMRPGITGYAQVRGRNTISVFDKINYDLIYIEKASIWMDIKVLILTVLTIFEKKGVDAGKSTIHEEIKELKEQDKLEISV